MGYSTVSARPGAAKDPLREWPRIQVLIRRLRKCNGASLLGLPVTCLVRLTYDLGTDPLTVITPELIRETANTAHSLGLFHIELSETEWLQRVYCRMHLR